MIEPARLDLVAYNTVHFVRSIRFKNEILAPALAAMQVRLYAGQPGAAVINLDVVSPGNEGIAITADGADSIVTIQINKETMQAEGFPKPGVNAVPGEAGDDLQLRYDLKILKLSDGLARIRLLGSLTIKQGITL